MNIQLKYADSGEEVFLRKQAQLLKKSIKIWLLALEELEQETPGLVKTILSLVITNTPSRAAYMKEWRRRKRADAVTNSDE